MQRVSRIKAKKKKTGTSLEKDYTFAGSPVHLTPLLISHFNRITRFGLRLMNQGPRTCFWYHLFEHFCIFAGGTHVFRVQIFVWWINWRHALRYQAWLGDIVISWKYLEDSLCLLSLVTSKIYGKICSLFRFYLY